METKRPTNPAAEEILGLYFPVLDYGFISLCDYMGTDQCIESAARVSYGAGTRKRNETRGLLRYLRRHRHTSPSEMVELKFHMCMPIFVARQMVRHRTVSLNEYSGRYSLMPMVFYTPPKEQFKKQSASNNKGRNGNLPDGAYEAAVEEWNRYRKNNADLYVELVEADVARELARIDLPLSTYTQWYWKTNLHNLLHFLGLRVDSHAQWEVREYANVMAGITKRVAPMTFEAWIDYDFCNVRFTQAELELLPRVFGDFNSDGFEKILGSKREVAEFRAKLEPKIPPNFDLDLTKAKSAQYFEQILFNKVPKVDKNTDS